MPAMDRINSNGSGRIHTRSTQPRTSSNRTFQEQFKDGLKNGISLTDSALKHVAKPIPGSAALSASLSDAARSLSTGSKLDSSLPQPSPGVEHDTNSLEEDFVQANQTLLEQQLRIAQITTDFTTKSNMIRSLQDTEKTIISNMRS